MKVRWMVRGDMFEIIQFAPISEDTLYRLVRRNDCIAKVLEIDEKIIGYFIYRCLPNKGEIRVAHFYIDPRYRRKSLGTKMFQSLIQRLSPKYQILKFRVSEYKDDMLIFLREMGCKWCETVHKSDSDKNYYIMYFDYSWIGVLECSGTSYV